MLVLLLLLLLLLLLPLPLLGCSLLGRQRLSSQLLSRRVLLPSSRCYLLCQQLLCHSGCTLRCRVVLLVRGGAPLPLQLPLTLLCHLLLCRSCCAKPLRCSPSQGLCCPLLLRPTTPSRRRRRGSPRFRPP